ncbi:hypothetical protein NPIL_635451 [Nephila pilipes]|uniref:Uncharacterized protein n=1 Tax=Nephila pilipes TaxID=299642 RepID=A0A8X6TY80_NEPPI|nr:hypothetical protein NPIL_635451 [Nephila pilipes]
MERNTTATPPLGMLGSLVATLLFALASPSDGTGGLGISAAGGGFSTSANASEITDYYQNCRTTHCRSHRNSSYIIKLLNQIPPTSSLEKYKQNLEEIFAKWFLTSIYQRTGTCSWRLTDCQNITNFDTEFSPNQKRIKNLATEIPTGRLTRTY